MKIDSKKITIFVILLFLLLAVALILSFTMFAPKNIQVHYLTTTNKLTGQEARIAESAKIEGSVFFFSRKEAKNNLEKAHPYLRVVGFEIVFPNQVIIHAAERETLFATSINAFYYALIDEDLKVLEKVSVSQYQSSQNPEILLSNFTFVNTNAAVGDFLDASSAREKESVKQLKNALLRNNRNNSVAKASFASFTFHNEVIDGTQINALQLIMSDHLGFVTTIYNIENALPEKLECYFRSRTALNMDEIATKSMVIIETSDRGIVSSLID